MVFAMMVVPFLLVREIGGVEKFWEGTREIEETVPGYASILGNPATTVTTLILWLTIPLGNLGQPHMLVRILAAKDRSTLIRGGLISSVWVGALFFGAITLGIAFRIYSQSEPLDDKEGVLFAVANNRELVSGFLGGLLAAAVLAAICSTVDSQLLVAGSNVSSDLFAKESKSNHYWVDRIAVFGVASVAFLLALLNNQSVFDFVLSYGFAGLGASFGPALILRLALKDRPGSDLSVLLSMIGGLATVCIWNATGLGKQVCYNLGPAVLAAFSFGLAGFYLNSLFKSSSPGK